MDWFVHAVDDALLARAESDEMVFEVTFDELVVNDVTLHFRRDGEKVGSVYNDDGTARTMAKLEATGEDFLGAAVPKAFVAEVLAVAEDHERVSEGRSTPERYRLRVLRNVDEGASD